MSQGPLLRQLSEFAADNVTISGQGWMVVLLLLLQLRIVLVLNSVPAAAAVALVES